MQRRLTPTPVIIAAAIAITAVAVVAGSVSRSSSAAPVDVPMAHTTIAEFNETEARHFIGRESETWRTRIYTRAGKFAGTGVIACVPTSTADSLQQCTGTYLLPRGRVAVQGLLSSRAGFNLVVVGGTDAYLGTRGALVVTQTQDTPRHARLTFFFS